MCFMSTAANLPTVTPPRITPAPRQSGARRDAADHEAAVLAAGQLERHLVSGFDAIQQPTVRDVEEHGHAGPVEALDRAVLDLDLARLRINRLDDPLGPMGMGGGRRQRRLPRDQHRPEYCNN